MNDRERRFERLERARREGSSSEPPEEARDVEGRFGAFEPPAPSSGSPLPPSASDRFREPPPRPIEVAPPSEEEQPFRRCMRCETDSSRYARRCERCGADLEQADQIAYNERLWAAQRSEREAERQREAERGAELERAAAETARLRRQAAEQMAAEVGRRERSRLDTAWGGDSFGGPTWDGGAGTFGAPVGIRLLRSIRDPRWRAAAWGLPFLVLLLSIGLARRAPGAAAVGIALLALLFIPGRWWMSRWSRWRRW